MTPPTARSRTATPRRYDSARRRESAASTRAAVLDAAAALFVERGWAGTAIRDIARVARVSVETVYSSVGPKAELLRAAIDISVVGDDDARPLAERPEFQALGRGSTRQRVAALGALLAGMFPRTAGLHRALQHAAPAEPALADVLAQTLARQRETTRLGAAAVAGRPPTDREVDGLHAVLSNDVYLQLTEHAGWSSETYQAWVGDIVVRLLDLDLDLDLTTPKNRTHEENRHDDRPERPRRHPIDAHRAHRAAP